jgi:hypothetical protein
MLTSHCAARSYNAAARNCCPCLLATLAVNLEDINHSLLVAQPVDYPRQAEHVTAIPSPCEKTAFLSHIYIYKRSFRQDRLGTIIGKTQNKMPFFAPSPILW